MYFRLLVLGFFLLICRSAHSLVEVPVRFPMMLRLPMIQVEIEGIQLTLMVDSGAGCDLMIRSEVIEQISNKREMESLKYMDIKGNDYTARTFQLPSIRIGNFEILNVLVLEDSIDFATKGSIIQGSKRFRKNVADSSDGRIGLGILARFNTLFDFPKSFFFDVENETPFDAQAAEVPFEVGIYGIILSIETDFGVGKFIMDTGANLSFVNQTLANGEETLEFIPGLNRYKSQKFVLGNKDFGTKQLYLIDMPSRFKGLDGILGVDFFRRHKIYLDYQNFKAYIW